MSVALLLEMAASADEDRVGVVCGDQSWTVAQLNALADGGAGVIAASGAGMSGASALHMNIFGLNPVVVFGTDEQKQRFLPPLRPAGKAGWRDRAVPR